MAKQELMLHESVNLNFQYENKLYKLCINIQEGLLVLSHIKSPTEADLIHVYSVPQTISYPKPNTNKPNTKKKKVKITK